VVAVLKEHFVCIEFNATENDGVPDDVPAMAVLNKTWDESPYCRVAFRSEWVLSSDGEHMLGVSPCNHDAAKAESTDFGGSFERLVEGSLARFERIRSHGNDAEAARAEAERIDAEVLAELRRIKPCWLDKDLMTEHYIKTVLAQDEEQEAFERRYCQLFDFEEPDVRRKAALNLSIYAEERATFEFATRLPYLSDRVALLLEDPDEGVRTAAAEALYHFRRQPVPDLQGQALVAAAGSSWWAGRERPAVEDEALAKSKLPAVWPLQRADGVE
jgi:hypothetical protein